MDFGGTDTRPRYVQVADELRRLITSGELPVGATLPPYSEISRAHGVAMSTVAKAVKLLQSEGFVKITNGDATYVITTTPATVQTEEEWRRDISGRVEALTAEIAALRTLVTDSQNADGSPQQSRATDE